LKLSELWFSTFQKSSQNNSNHSGSIEQWEEKVWYLNNENFLIKSKFFRLQEIWNFLCVWTIFFIIPMTHCFVLHSCGLSLSFTLKEWTFILILACIYLIFLLLFFSGCFGGGNSRGTKTKIDIDSSARGKHRYFTGQLFFLWSFTCLVLSIEK